MLQINKIHCLDVREGLKQMPDESVDCVVTSPPYWALRDYGKAATSIWDAKLSCRHRWGNNCVVKRSGGKGKYRSEAGHYVNRSSFCTKCGAWRGQFGLEPDFDLYLQHLIAIFDEVQRVLKKTGTLWVNVGDTYAGSWGSYAPNRLGCKPSNESTTWHRRAYSDRSFRPPSSFKQRVRERSLCMIPSRFAIAMTDRNWILRNEIIWHKPNAIPSSAKTRFTDDFEKLFFFVKAKKYQFQQQIEDFQGKDERRWAGTYETDGTLIQGASSAGVQRTRRNGKMNGRNKRCVWRISTKSFPDAHFAVFPEKLIETPIKAGSPAGGLVLDPFMGAGTTAIVARKLGRNYLGFEVNCDYVKLARRRLAREAKSMKKEVGT